MLIVDKLEGVDQLTYVAGPLTNGGAASLARALVRVQSECKRAQTKEKSRTS